MDRVARPRIACLSSSTAPFTDGGGFQAEAKVSYFLLIIYVQLVPTQTGPHYRTATEVAAHRLRRQQCRLSAHATAGTQPAEHNHAPAPRPVTFIVLVHGSQPAFAATTTTASAASPVSECPTIRQTQKTSRRRRRCSSSC